MNPVERLTGRLEALAQVLEARPEALALLGLGSVGLESARLDAWSDLDFFVIVQAGGKKTWLTDPSWLSEAAPVAYRFQNTEDGFKLLWADGVFGEMAVFEPEELPNIPFTEGRVWWHRSGFDLNLLKPRNHTGQAWTPPSAEHCLGELLTCLYVGLCRWHRGEKLSAWRFIQGYCLDRVLELAEFWLPVQPGLKDPYNRDRRVEGRYPQLEPVFRAALLGYERSPEAALALLAWVKNQAPDRVNAALSQEIERLARL